jgi:hypothetical protein
MTDFDRYDFAMSMVMGLIMAGVLVIGGPFWAIYPILAVGVTIGVYRHFVDLPTHRSRR